MRRFRPELISVSRTRMGCSIRATASSPVPSRWSAGPRGVRAVHRGPAERSRIELSPRWVWQVVWALLRGGGSRGPEADRRDAALPAAPRGQPWRRSLGALRTRAAVAPRLMEVVAEIRARSARGAQAHVDHGRVSEQGDPPLRRPLLLTASALARNVPPLLVSSGPGSDRVGACWARTF